MNFAIQPPVAQGLPSESLELCYELFLMNRYRSGSHMITFQRRADGHVDQYVDGVRIESPRLLTHAAIPRITYHGDSRQRPPSSAHEFIRRWISHVRAQ